MENQEGRAAVWTLNSRQLEGAPVLDWTPLPLPVVLSSICPPASTGPVSPRPQTQEAIRHLL